MRYCCGQIAHMQIILSLEAAVKLSCSIATTILFACTAPTLAGEPVWRFNGDRGGHFYTTSCEEGEFARGEYKMAWEGNPNPAFFIEGYNTPGTVPFYRFFDGTHHFYTTSSNAEGADGFSPEGIIGFIYSNMAKGTTPLYRSYNPGSQDHFYTTSKVEWEQSFGSYPVDHEIAGYVPVSGNIACRPSGWKLKVYPHTSHEGFFEKMGDGPAKFFGLKSREDSNTQKGQGVPTQSNTSSVGIPRYSATYRVDCQDALTKADRADDTITATSFISEDDARNYILNIANKTDLCQANGDKSRVTKAGTGRWM
jgi:Repeat of unknown function (DUF5648)